MKLSKYLEELSMKGSLAPGASSKEMTTGAGQSGTTQNTQVEYAGGKFYKIEGGKQVPVNLPAPVVAKLEKAVQAQGLTMDDISKMAIPPVDFFIHSDGTVEVKQKNPEQ